MYTIVKTLSLIALTGSALAAPAVDSPSQLERRGGWGEWHWGGRPAGKNGPPAAPTAAPTAPWTNWASTATVYVTGAAPTPTPAAAEATPTPAAGQFYGPPSGGSDWGSSAPAASPAPASAPSSNDGSWQSVVAEWRAKGGYKAFTFDSQLTANAQKTADESVGGLHHQLNPGSMGQVLAPGDLNNFEHVYVGGWLCEIPSLPGLNGVCAEQSKGWSYQGQTGHAEILTSPNYSKIGCAYGSGTGVWACDVA
jgi:Cysteine-rich secretory protein family